MSDHHVIVLSFVCTVIRSLAFESSFSINHHILDFAGNITVFCLDISKNFSFFCFT